MLFSKSIKQASRTFIPRFFAVSLTLALGLGVLIQPTALSAPGQINSTNNGRDITGGTYFNTAGSRTTFSNSGSGGLWVHSGTTVRGLETDGGGNTTGNGGNLHFNAPGSVVRLDGSIDVSALKNGTLFTGNGGQVTVDSAFLYQNGTIFANGHNGGNVTFNVGSATLGPQARIEALGVGGAGGQVVIHGDGVVDIQSGALITTNGKVVDPDGTNFIEIQSGVVNNAGILRANGVLGSKGGTIRLIATGSTSTTAQAAIDAVDDTAATGEADAMFTPDEATALKQQIQNLASTNDGDVLNSGNLSVNGVSAIRKGNGASGGIIHIEALNGTFDNSGLLQSNGGNGAGGGKGGSGGVITVNAADVINTDTLQANGGQGSKGKINGGKGGSGGKITVSATDDIHNLILNQSFIQAYGGNGGRASKKGKGGVGGAGGTITLTAGHDFVNNCCIDVSGGTGGRGRMGGNGGKGGRVTVIASHLLDNHHSIRANGGNGGKGTKRGGKGGKKGRIILRGTSNIHRGIILAKNGVKGTP